MRTHNVNEAVSVGMSFRRSRTYSCRAGSCSDVVVLHSILSDAYETGTLSIGTRERQH